MRVNVVAGLMAVSACGVAGSGLAQDAGFRIEEVVVTATKTGETRIQDTPIAISAFGGDDLNRMAVADIRGLAEMTPNLAVSENTGFSQVFIRGIGSNNVFAGSDPSSTLHMDGVYLARPMTYFSNLFDVERVEILRGPQGTLYGRNSVGGTINVVSRKPHDELSGKAELGYGNYEAVQGKLYINTPIAENLFASVAGLYSEHEGYIKNINPSGNDIDDDDTKSIRAQLRWNPGRVDAILRADYSRSEGAIMGFSKLLEPRGAPMTDALLGDFRTIANNLPHEHFRKAYGFAADINVALADNMDLKSLSAYRKSRYHASFDTDASDLDLQRSLLDEYQDQISQEFNLTGHFGPLSMIAGAFYFRETVDYPISIEVRGPGTAVTSSPHVVTESFAFFQQSDLALFDSFKATFGLRYTEEDKEFSQHHFIRSLATGLPVSAVTIYDAKGKYKAWTPKFGLEWQPAEDLMLYASASRGFKSGGFVNGSTNPDHGFGPEKLWAYEAGVKSEWLDRKLTLNLSAFYYDYTDLQVNFFLAPGVVDIRNAADATVKGLEFEFGLRPLPTTHIQGSVSFLDATYDTFLNAPRRGNQAVFDASGADLNNAPKHLVTLSAEQILPTIGNIESSFRIDASWNGRRYFTPENNLLESQGNYFLLNASLEMRINEDVTVTIWGRNLTDEEYVTGTASFASLLVAGRVGAPRTYGVKLGYDF